MAQIALTKDFLEKVYCKDGLSTWAIEKKYHFPRSRVYNAIKRYGLSTRDLARSHILYDRKDFSGDEVEKAYLIGFSEGDLRVRNHGGSKSQTISIACGSTKKAQIDLIHSLFSRYGRVWVGKPNARGVVNIEAFVNRSFAFLVPESRNYVWCAGSEENFFAFLAGFTDAEGSLFIARNQARIAWGNEDKDILTFIAKTLSKFGIVPSKLICDFRAGKLSSTGYRFNRDYCHVECIRKEAVRDCIRKMGTYLRHADKLVALTKIQRNLLARGMTL